MTVIFVSVVAFISLGALYELYCAFQRIGVRPSIWTGTLALIALFVMAGMNAPLLAFMGAINLYILISLTQHLIKKDLTGSLVDWVFSLSGVLYVGFTMMHFVLIARIQGVVETPWVEGVVAAIGAGGTALGLAWLGVALTTTWATGSVVRLAGRIRGASRPVTKVSPAETRRGVLAGLIAGTITGGLAGYLFGVPVPLAVMFLSGGVIAVGAMVGGVCEALVKRQLGASHAGPAAIGRTGLLDQIAALRVSAPLTFYLAMFLKWQA